MKSHGLWMIIGYILPLLLIFMLPVFGVSNRTCVRNLHGVNVRQPLHDARLLSWEDDENEKAPALIQNASVQDK